MATIVKHQPPPAEQPPPTFDLCGLTLSEMQSLVMLCYHSTTFQQYMKNAGFVKASLGEELNRLYHLIKTEVHHP